jgi:hypothetical protein
MSETAKQDTTKVPAAAPETRAAETGPAGTESAATPGPAGQPRESAQPETTAEPAEAAQAKAEAPAQPDLDETKRKFREALERKHQVHNEGQGKGGRDGGKINGAHGPAASRRSFRRKSG